MTGKAKPKKHTAKEIAAKIDAATTNRGGGKAGVADRSGQEKGGHAKLECPLCKTTAPDVKSMRIHHDARHPKIPFDESKLTDLHVANVADTSKARPGVRGSFKKEDERSAAGKDKLTLTRCNFTGGTCALPPCPLCIELPSVPYSYHEQWSEESVLVHMFHDLVSGAVGSRDGFLILRVAILLAVYPHK